MTERDMVTATALAKRYHGDWALRDCSLSIPQGRVVALVGPNGAGKTTLLHLAVGLLEPTRGHIRVLGEPAGKALPNVAFLAQEKPLYPGFTVADMLRFGRHLNPRWDKAFAERRLADLGISAKRKTGRLSGGQQAQVALTMAIAKRPELLVLDEPLANLDPLARHEVMTSLMAAVAERELSVVLSSHVVADLTDTCDWLIVLNRGAVQVNGDIDDLTDRHRVLSCPAGSVPAIADRFTVVEQGAGEGQTSLLVRAEGQAVFDPQWPVRSPCLEELVLAYLRRPEAAVLPRPTLTSAT
ncbi:ABC transporter ATP-binding protein [Prauserella marina]|uniref:ABC-2 type transport system ATP-binding protein n=1 Tax=Prauserella marina TaxID=530584 RepID=A0A222VSZ2_9PSEU|nr:ABC transporter ATP-binding protein [Prauserella marina]ASR37000.1 ABC transporter ATP-binding protein [Prauserella marina]PWV80028.1 ABC-2 type transport system ATP-binding protein [Prauserella marina]SDD84763.1 ABC-2 type transport system ATP-binding protein [Prauserella marina]